MRIEAYNNISQIYQMNKPAKTKASDKVQGRRDEVQISSFGRDFAVAKKAVAEASDIREDRVAEVKAKYSGGVDVDTGDFASVLLNKYQGL